MKYFVGEKLRHLADLLYCLLPYKISASENFRHFPKLSSIFKPETGKKYVGETRLSISSRIYQHQKASFEGKWNYSGVSDHCKSCHETIDWNSPAITLKIESGDFDRKVREALEIQRNDCGPNNGGMNQDFGDYVTTGFWKPLMAFVNRQRFM